MWLGTLMMMMEGSVAAFSRLSVFMQWLKQITKPFMKLVSLPAIKIARLS